MSSKPKHYATKWQGCVIEVRYTSDWLGMAAGGSDYSTAHLEVMQPDRIPLPFTETGYRSRFIAPEDIEAAGGPVAYVEQWLDWAAQDPAWREAQAAGRQLALL